LFLFQLSGFFFVKWRERRGSNEEKAGRQFKDDMTPAKAANIRVKRIEGDQLSNKEKRDFEEQQKKAEASKWTVDRLWEEYKKQRADSKSLIL